MNLVGEWGACLARALVEGGVRDVVVSPGSRSTPVLVACARARELRLHLVIDERSAAFFALGLTRASGLPVAVLCTSGTAGANYLPAVVEADEARLPLVIVTADRPASLMHCGANQTIEQLSLFTGRTRFTADLGEPEPTEAAFRGLGRTVKRAVSAATGPEPGPVHLDARFDKPLEPGPAETPEDLVAEVSAEAARRSPVGLARRAGPASAGPRLAPGATLDRIATALRESSRPVLVAGPRLPRGPGRGGLAEAAFDLCRAGDVPLLAEATSQLRFAGPRRRGVRTFDTFALAYRTAIAREALCPDFILQVGAYPVARGYEQLLRSRPIERIVLADHGWPDPVGDAAEVVVADVEATLEGLGARVAAAPRADRDEAFAGGMETADAALHELIEGIVAAGPFGEAAVATTVVASLPEGATLVVGNSLPVRELSLVCPGSLADLSVLSQRGASGIDGLVSGAAGAATASGQPTLLYLGDVSFLHDLGGLMTARGLDAPLVIVVSNNDGGRIFEQLPVAAAALPDGAWELFTTPHGLSFGAAAELYGHRYAEVGDPGALRRAIAVGLGEAGCTIVEAKVPRGSAAREMAALSDGASEALRAALPGGAP